MILLSSNFLDPLLPIEYFTIFMHESCFFDVDHHLILLNLQDSTRSLVVHLFKFGIEVFVDISLLLQLVLLLLKSLKIALSLILTFSFLSIKAVLKVVKLLLKRLDLKFQLLNVLGIVLSIIF